MNYNDSHVKSMQRHERQSCGAIRMNETPRMAQIERFFPANGANRAFRAALTNQELALAVTSLQAEAENPKQQWRTK